MSAVSLLPIFGEIVFALVVGLVLAETLARVVLKYLFDYDSSIQFDSRLGWRLRANLRGARKWTDEFTYHVFTDTFGFRVGQDHRCTPDKCDVLLLGDSFCFGEGVEFEDSIAGQIARSNPELKVINTAVSAYGTDQEFLMLQRNIHLVSPGGTVLLLTYINDFDEIIKRSNGGLHKPWCEFRGSEFILHEPSSIWDRICGLTRMLGRGGTRLKMLLGWGESPRYAYNIQAARIYRELISLMAEITKKAECSLAVAYTTGKEAGSPNALAWGDFVKRCALESRAHFVNLDENSEGLQPGMYFDKDIHWTPGGTAVNHKYLMRNLGCLQQLTTTNSAAETWELIPGNGNRRSS